MLSRVVPGIFEANCDRCGKWAQTKAADKLHAFNRLKRMGWTLGDAKRDEEIVCGDCRALEAMTRHEP